MEPLEQSIFPERVTYAGFWERFAAAFIDGIIVGVVAAVLNLTLFKDNIFGTVINLAWQWLYYALQEASVHQATVGKRALGLTVTNLSGGRISFGQATGRYFGKIISAVILLIGYFMMLWDDRRQTLHD